MRIGVTFSIATRRNCYEELEIKEVTFAVIGYGGRGRTFASLIKKNQQLFSRVVAVAEPDPEKRALAIKECNLTSDQVFEKAS